MAEGKCAVNGERDAGKCSGELGHKDAKKHFTERAAETVRKPPLSQKGKVQPHVNAKIDNGGDTKAAGTKAAITTYVSGSNGMAFYSNARKTGPAGANYSRDGSGTGAKVQDAPNFAGTTNVGFAYKDPQAGIIAGASVALNPSTGLPLDAVGSLKNPENYTVDGPRNGGLDNNEYFVGYTGDGVKITAGRESSVTAKLLASRTLGNAADTTFNGSKQFGAYTGPESRFRFGLHGEVKAGDTAIRFDAAPGGPGRGHFGRAFGISAETKIADQSKNGWGTVTVGAAVDHVGDGIAVTKVLGANSGKESYAVSVGDGDSAAFGGSASHTDGSGNKVTLNLMATAGHVTPTKNDPNRYVGSETNGGYPIGAASAAAEAKYANVGGNLKFEISEGAYAAVTVGRSMTETGTNFTAANTYGVEAGIPLIKEPGMTVNAVAFASVTDSDAGTLKGSKNQDGRSVAVGGGLTWKFENRVELEPKK
jgi:hypothetical protein